MSQRLDAWLVHAGLARSRGHASQLIAEGRVVVDQEPAVRPAQKISPEQQVALTGSEGIEYASRAGHKLAGALDALGPSAPAVTGRRCLDIGASTGGFTDVLLRRGAASVVAIDVGHDQLRAHLRDDPRVEVHEGVNARYLDPSLVAPTPSLAVADVSFISLTLIIEPVLAALTQEADLVIMVKPQFEIGKDRLGSTGVVTSPAQHVECIEKVARHAVRAGCVVSGIVPSVLPGPNGNREFFIHLRRGAEGFPQEWDGVVEMVQQAVHSQEIS